MKLDTHFELGERLWYLKGGRVYAVAFHRITCEIAEDGTKNPPRLTWRGDIQYLDDLSLNSSNMQKNPRMEDIFRTREEAGQELLKRAGFDCKVTLS